MTKFCDICNNLLVSTYTDDMLYFECMSCRTRYNHNKSDTLRYQSTKKKTVIYRTLLEKSVDDPTVLKAYVDCPKCDNKIVKQVRIGKNMELYNVCINCRYIWHY
jgi:DNA-directed RNA polymerase subunit M/transcription elongation factor TFIIS